MEVLALDGLHHSPKWQGTFGTPWKLVVVAMYANVPTVNGDVIAFHGLTTRRARETLRMEILIAHADDLVADGVETLCALRKLCVIALETNLPVSVREVITFDGLLTTRTA